MVVYDLLHNHKPNHVIRKRFVGAQKIKGENQMNEEDKVPQSYEKVSGYKGKQITTVFNQKGQIKRVFAQEVNPEREGQSELAKMIDHTLLKADATVGQIDKLCQEALDYGFGAVCVNGYWVKHCKQVLAGSQVKTAAVVGFPLGAMASKAKVSETKRAVKHGAVEIDMVMNIGELRAGNLAAVARDVQGVVQAAHAGEAIVKVIIETCLLTDDEKVTACLLAKEAGADFVKTSTGFSNAGATVEDVALMRSIVGPDVGVKAAGGIRSYEDALRMIEAGANRIGASSGIQIVEEELRRKAAG